MFSPAAVFTFDMAANRKRRRSLGQDEMPLKRGDIQMLVIDTPPATLISSCAQTDCDTDESKENKPSIVKPEAVNTMDIENENEKNEKYDPTYARHIFENKYEREMEVVLKTPVCSQAILSGTQTFYQLYQLMCSHTTEMCFENGLHTNTLMLTVSLVDRALHALMPKKKIRFRLLGCTCLLLACKIEETYVRLSVYREYGVYIHV
jgi:hypothetical protein